MKKIISIIIISLICIAAYNLATAQVKYSFINLDKKYEFNLPQFDLSIPLPAKAGFRTPQIPDGKAMLEIDYQTIYCFDLDKIGTDRDAGRFVFSVSGSEDYYLYLQINEMSIGDLEKRKKELSKRATHTQLSDLKIKLGKDLFSVSDGESDFHNLHHKGYLFSFHLSSKMPQKVKNQYLDIIRNVQSKDLRSQRLKYENRVKYGYFERLDINTPEERASRKFPNWEGNVDLQTSFTWDVFHIQTTIPANWKYHVNAEQLIESRDKRHVQVVIDSLYLYYNPMMISWFASDSLTFTIRSYTKAANVNMESMIKQMAASVNYSTTKTINIDGIAMPVTLYGTQEMANIDTYYEANNVTHWLSFSSVTKQTLPLVDEILSSVKIDQPQIKSKKVSQKSYTKLSHYFTMKEAEAVQLDSPLLVPYIDENNLIDCNLPNVGMKLRVLGPEDQWFCSVGNERVKMKNGVIEAAPVNNTDKRLTIYSMRPEGVYYNISKIEDSSVDLKTYAENFKRNFASYKEISVMHASVTTVNDRSWCIFIYKQGEQYMGMFTTVSSGYEMSISATGTNYDEVVKKSGYIRMVNIY